MRKIFLFSLISILLLVSFVSSETANITDTGWDDYIELSLKFTMDCQQQITNSIITNTLYGLNPILGFTNMWKHNPLLGAKSLCDQQELYQKYVTDVNNITDTYNQISATQLDQIGLEEYVYDKEKEQTLTNINLVWNYIHLLVDITIEIIMIFFYLLQLYMLVYILFIMIPKAFLKIRDGISIFLVKRSAKYKEQRAKEDAGK
jgi:hypothetical protein